MNTTLDDLLGLPEAEFTARRVGGTSAALARCGLSLEGIRDLFADQAGSYRHLLVTSSVSQGLSNRNSDIDVIGITEEATPTLKMAVQKFVGAVHSEIIVFSTAEWDRARADLEAAAAMPLADSLRAARTWNKTCPVTLKYLERVVNGVDVTGTMPYLEALPALSVFWERRSFEVARKCVLCALLAERAGENRGRLGYALNALLYLMDAVLSHHGRVFNNKKWYLLRWRGFVRSREYHPRFAAVAGELDARFDEVCRACREPGSGPGPGPDLLRVYEAVRDRLGVAVQEEAVLEDLGTRAGVFLPGATYRCGGPGAAFMDTSGGAAALASLPAALSLDAPAARSILGGIRAGVYQVILRG